MAEDQRKPIGLPRGSQEPSLVSLESILEYLSCPLKVRYREWGATGPEIEPAEVVRMAVEMGVVAFCRAILKPWTTKQRAGTIACEAFEEALREHHQTLRDNQATFSEHFSRGLKVLKDLVIMADHPLFKGISGPMAAVVARIEDVEVISSILGVVEIGSGGGEPPAYAVVHIERASPFKRTTDRVREGYLFTVYRQLLQGDLHRSPLEILRIDPWEAKISRHSITQDDQRVFEALTRVAVRGMEAKLYPPQPLKENCRVCIYDKACRMSYARPDPLPWMKPEFLKAWREP